MKERPEGFRPVPWGLGDIILAIVAVVVGLAALFIVLGSLNRGADPEEIASLPPWAGFALQAILIASVWFFGFFRHGVRPSSVWFMQRVSPKSLFLFPAIMIVLMITVSAVYGGLVELIDVEILEPPPLEEQRDLLGTGFNMVLNIGVIVLWGPFSEELFFRGFLLAGLIPVVGVVRSMVVSSAIFAAAHLLIGTLIPIFFLGMLLAWLFVRTKSVWPPFVAHAIWNLLATLVSIYLLD